MKKYLAGCFYDDCNIPEGHYPEKYYTDEDWINGIFTKVILEAKNKNQLMKAVKMAEDLGMEEGKDFFLIKDCCLTELTPEEVDENGVGRTLSGIVIQQICKIHFLFSAIIVGIQYMLRWKIS